MSEPIYRAYREIKSKVELYKERIKAIEEEMAKIRALYPYMTDSEIIKINPVFRSFYYSKLAHLRWLRYYESELKRLEEMVKVRFVKLAITFSIDTEVSHGELKPFFAEVCLETAIDEYISTIEEGEIAKRCVNFALKIFWIMFDALKDIGIPGKYSIRGSYLKSKYGTFYDDVFKRVRFVQLSKTKIDEAWIDKLITDIIKMEGLSRTNLDEYVTRESIIKIGIERIPVEEKKPAYPLVDLIIEKENYVIRRQGKIAKETEIDMAKILKIRLGI